MNDGDDQRVPHPHGGQLPHQSLAQETTRSREDNGQDTGHSSHMPSQQPILPYDRVSEPQTTGEIFQENQRQLKEHLVYPPVDPNKQLPPTKRVKMMPKTPKPTHHKPVRLNDPPEEGPLDELMADEEIVEEQKENTQCIAESIERSTSQAVVPPRQTASQPGSQLQACSTSQAGSSLQTTTSQAGSSFQTTTSQTGPSLQASSSRAGPSVRDDAPAEVDKPMDVPSPTVTFKQPHNYEELDLIGNGAYGTVYRGRDLTDKGKFVALKKIRISLTEDGVPVNAVREIALLKNLDNFRHPNIVRLLDICHGRPDSDRRLNLVLVFEFIDMDLDNYLKKIPSPGLEPAKIKYLFHQILNGVDFLHQNRVIHRDLKPQNILIDRHDRLKIADFGLARIYDYKMKVTSMVVTLWYRAPEILLSDSYASPVDIWSCACIFAELFRKRPLFVGQSESEQLQKIFEVIGTPSEREWPTNVHLCVNQFKGNVPKALPDIVPKITSDACDLLQKMLKFVPDNRTSAHQSLKHPYFDSLRNVEALASGTASSSKDPYGLGLVPMIVEESAGPSSSQLPRSSAAASTNINRPVSEPASNDENNPNSSNVTSSSQSAAAAKHAQVSSSSNRELQSSSSQVPSASAGSAEAQTSQSEGH